MKPITFFTVGAPIGWWIKDGPGPKARKLAHLWKGRDGRIHSFSFEGSEPTPRGPFDSKEEALAVLQGLFQPRQEARNGR